MQRDNCHGCKHLKCHEIPNTKIWYCGHKDPKDGPIVPHESNPEGATFWRVPMSCPLPDTEVKKREKQAPKKTWSSVKY